VRANEVIRPALDELLARVRQIQEANTDTDTDTDTE
jgi:hypothetical protein